MPRRYPACTNTPACSARGIKRCANCKASHAAYMRAYNRKNREAVNAARRRRRHTSIYGLTDAEKLELFESSDGLCALCLEEPATVIDHDHETGEVRGVLCSFCNKGLGFIEQMGATSADIVEYLSTSWRNESAA